VSLEIGFVILESVSNCTQSKEHSRIFQNKLLIKYVLYIYTVKPGKELGKKFTVMSQLTYLLQIVFIKLTPKGRAAQSPVSWKQGY
jgi:hypothetical protein